MGALESRERGAAAVGHREPDMVPIEHNGTIVTSLARVADANLRKFLHLPQDDNPEVDHKATDTVRALPDLPERYAVDTRAMGVGSPDDTIRARVAENGIACREMRLGENLSLMIPERRPTRSDPSTRGRAKAFLGMEPVE